MLLVLTSARLVNIGRSRIEDMLTLYDTVAAAGETTFKEINRNYRLDFDGVSDVPSWC